MGDYCVVCIFVCIVFIEDFSSVLRSVVVLAMMVVRLVISSSKPILKSGLYLFVWSLTS